MCPTWTNESLQDITAQAEKGSAIQDLSIGGLAYFWHDEVVRIRGNSRVRTLPYVGV